jgi:hypothetical protein
MNAGAALDPAFDMRRRAVLACTCAVHLLALLLWTQQRRPLPARPSRVVTFFLQADGSRAARPPARTDRHPGPTPSRPAPVPAVPSRATPTTRTAQVPGSEARTETRADTHIDMHIDMHTDTRTDTAPAQAAPAPDGGTSASDLFDTARPAGTAADARTRTPTPPGSASTQGGFAAGLAQHQAGRIDHELRKGKPGVPDEADTPWARFRRGLESAHIDRSLTLQSDTYTSPDGVVIYRFRRGNSVRCRRAGGVGMPLAGMPGGGSVTMPSAGSAAETDCPKGVTWNRDGP